MAIIPVQRVVPHYFNVDPNHDAVANPIVAGQFITLDGDGFVVAGGEQTALGIAGDTISSIEGGNAHSENVVVNPSGGTRSTSNRVSDMFNETLASGKMTVYMNGGVFRTDQVVAGQTWTPGAAVYSDAAGLATTTDPGAGRVVGYVIEPLGDFPSGVPGNEVDGSISLGEFVTIKLAI